MKFNSDYVPGGIHNFWIRDKTSAVGYPVVPKSSSNQVHKEQEDVGVTRSTEDGCTNEETHRILQNRKMFSSMKFNFDYVPGGIHNFWIRDKTSAVGYQVVPESSSNQVHKEQEDVGVTRSTEDGCTNKENHRILQGGFTTSSLGASLRMFGGTISSDAQ